MPRPGPDAQRAKECRNRRFLRRLVVGAGLSCLVLCPWVIGCAGGNNRMANDPLLGTPGSRPSSSAPLAAAAPLAPPTPSATPSSLTSNAALAGSTPRVLDSSNDLRIGASTPAATFRPAPSSTFTPAPNSRYGQEPSSGAVLNRPVPAATIPSTTLAFAPTVRGSSQPSGGRVTTYEQAQSFLAAQGVTWQRLETWGDKGEWRFSCSIPNKQNQYISRNYEAKARDYLAAIQAVIEQMQKEH